MVSEVLVASTWASEELAIGLRGCLVLATREAPQHLLVGRVRGRRYCTTVVKQDLDGRSVNNLKAEDFLADGVASVDRYSIEGVVLPEELGQPLNPATTEVRVGVLPELA